MSRFHKPVLQVENVVCTAMHNKHEYFEQHGNITVSLSGPKQIKQVNISSLASLAALSLSIATT